MARTPDRFPVRFHHLLEPTPNLPPFDPEAYTSLLVRGTRLDRRRDAIDPLVPGSFNYTIDPVIRDAATRPVLLDLVRRYCRDASVPTGSLRVVQPRSAVSSLVEDLVTLDDGEPQPDLTVFVNDVTVNSSYARTLIDDELARRRRVRLLSLLVRDSPLPGKEASPAQLFDRWLGDRGVRHYALASTERVGALYLASSAAPSIDGAPPGSQ